MASLAEKIKMILWGGDMEPLRKIMVLSFMALNLHQFEEYAMPGGFPMVMNRAFMGETEVPERFPLNKKSAFVCNVLLMYPLYLLAIVFCQQIWLGLTMVVTGVAQIFVHGIAFNRKLGTLYNPGMATIIGLFIPLCALYIWTVVQMGVVRWWHWLVALFLQPIVGMLCLMGPIKLLQDRQSPDIWPPHEAERFHVAEKLAR